MFFSTLYTVLVSSPKLRSILAQRKIEKRTKRLTGTMTLRLHNPRVARPPLGGDTARLYCTCLRVCFLSGAAKKKEYVDRPVEELYNEALDQMERKLFSEASAKFDEVERQHPYSVWAT